MKFQEILALTLKTLVTIRDLFCAQGPQKGKSLETGNVPIFRSSSHHGKLAQGGPRDDGFRNGIRVVLTYPSELPAEWELCCRAGNDLSWWSDGKKKKKE